MVGNSIKFTPSSGTILVRTQSFPHSPKASPLPRTWQPHLLLEVTDTGMGIDKSVLPKLFNAFEQVSQFALFFRAREAERERERGRERECV